MASTKVKEPNEKQLAILKFLTSARRLRITKTTKNERTKTAVDVAASKSGKPIETGDLDLNAKTVMAMIAAGWLSEVGKEAGTKDDVFTEIASYEITDDGKLAKKGK